MSDTIELLERAGVKVLSQPGAAVPQTYEEKSLDRGQVGFDSVDGWYPVFQYWQQGFVGERIPQRALELIRKYRSWTYACANINATALASVPLRLFCAQKQQGKKLLFPHKAVSGEQLKFLSAESALTKYLTNAEEVVEVTEHPLLDLLRYVNDGWNFFITLELTCIYIDLCGMAFWALDRNTRTGLPQAFTVLPSQYTWPHWTRAGEVYEYVFGFLPNQMVFDTEEVIFFKQPSPIHQILGYGPGHGAYGGTMIQDSVEDYTDRTFKNNAVPAGILSPEEPLTDDQGKKVIEEWNRKYAGALNAGKVALAPFKVKFEAMQGNFRLLAQLADRKVSRDEIAACYNVPLSKLDLSKADASAVQGDIAHRRDAILPRCRRIEAVLNKDLVPLYDEDLFLAFDNPVPPDREYHLRRAQAMAATSGIVYINEVRKELELPPDPALDGQLVERPAAGAGLPAPPAAPRNPESDQVRSASSFMPAVRAAIKSTTNEERLARRLRALFAEQRRAVLAEASYARIMSAARYYHQGTKSTKNTILGSEKSLSWCSSCLGGEKLFDFAEQNEWVDRFMSGTREFLERDIKSGAAAGADAIGMQISFNIERPEVQQFLDDYSFRFAHVVNETTYSQVRQALKTGMTEGQTYSEIAGAINDVFDNAEGARSMLIAQTEGARALNAGTVEAWKLSGQVQGYYWDADPSACEFCRALAEAYGPNGEVMKLGENFAAAGSTLPGQDGGAMRVDYADVPHPPLHPRCICSLEPVLVGEKHVAA